MAASSVIFINPLAVRFVPLVGELDDLELGDEIELPALCDALGTSNDGVYGRDGEMRGVCVDVVFVSISFSCGAGL